MPAGAAASHAAHHHTAGTGPGLHGTDSKAKGAGKTGKKRKVKIQDDHWVPSHYPATPGEHAIKNTARVHLRCCRGHHDWQRRTVITTSDFLALTLPEAGSRVRVSTLCTLLLPCPYKREPDCASVVRAAWASAYRCTRSDLTSCMPLRTGRYIFPGH